MYCAARIAAKSSLVGIDEGPVSHLCHRSILHADTNSSSQRSATCGAYTCAYHSDAAAGCMQACNRAVQNPGVRQD